MIPEISELKTADIARFWQSVDIRSEDECWEWQRCKIGSGYGGFTINRKMITAHRFSFLIQHGEIPQRCVCHHCDNKICVNPKHLFAGSNKDNFEDMLSKGRFRHGDGSKNPKGEAHRMAKLNEHGVRQIRELVAGGEKPCLVAAKFGVTYRNVYSIVTRHTWRHVA